MSTLLNLVTGRHGVDGWYAHPAAQPELKVTGASESEAVGRLVIAKARRLGVYIKRAAEQANGDDKPKPKTKKKGK